MGVSLTAHAVYVPTMDSPLIHSIVHKKFSGGVSPAYRPGRNTIFLSIAVAIAEGLGAGSVYYGAIKDDQRVFPDCREEYVEAWNKIMQVGLANPVRVMAPLIQRRKREVVEFCFREKLPIHRTWSCYRPKEQHQCGTCDACEQRRKAFRDAGERDTTVYASVSEAKRAGISRKSDQ
jgi:7-cyano-7-deazaguanine synthase